MAEVSYEDIKLEIVSDSSDAEKSVEKLAASLMGLNRALTKIGKNAAGIRKITDALTSLKNVRLPNLAKNIDQLERLGKVDFSNLKNLKIDIDLSGLTEAEKKTLAVKNALSTVAPKAKEASKQLTDTFQLDSNASKKVSSLMTQLYKEFANGSDKAVTKGIFNEIQETILKAGSIARTEIDDSFSYLNGKQAEFLSEFGNGKKFFLTPDQLSEATGLQAGDAGKRLGKYLSYIVSDATKGIKLDDSVWSELIDNYGNGKLFQSGELENVRSMGEMVQLIINKVIELKSLSKERISISDAILGKNQNLSDNAVDMVGERVKNSIRGAKNAVNEAVQSEYQKFSTQIPLDVAVDPKRFEQQIRNAIDVARKANYGSIDVDISVSTSKLRNSITQALSGADITQMQGVTTQLHDMLTVMREMSTINVKEGGLSTLVNSILRLSESTKKFDASSFNTFTTALRDVVQELSQVGQGTESALAFLKTINSLSRIGDKMKGTAEYFPTISTEIRELFETINNMDFSDKAVKMAESLAQISKNASKTTGSLKSVSDSTTETSNSFSIARAVFEGFKDTANTLSSVFKKLGSAGASAISSLSSKIKELTSHKENLSGLTNTFKQLFTIIVGFRGITGVFNWVKDSLQLGGDLTEIDHIVDSVYDDMSDTVKAWADSMVESHGIASSAAKRYAGTLTAMAKSYGIAADDAAIMGVKMTEAAADLSAFFNIDYETAYSKMRSALSGMSRPLEQLGISTKAATLAEYAHTLGIEKKYNSMTQAEKVMLRYRYIMDVMNGDIKDGVQITGDYARTQYSYANSLRKFTSYLAEIKTQIGAGFTATLRPLIVALNTLMKGLLKAAQAFAVFMKTLFPFTNGASGMALGDSIGYEDDLAQGAENAADGLSDASDSAKKLKKDLSVLPFDELNQLNKDKDSSSSGSGNGGIGALGGLGSEGLYDWDSLLGSLEGTKIPDAINKWAERIRESFEKHDWKGLGANVAGLLNEGIEKIYELFNPDKVAAKINPYIDAFTTTFNSLVDNLNWEMLGEDIGYGIDILVNAVNRIIDPKTGIDWNNIGKKLSEGANGLVSAIDFKALGEMFALRINIVWEVASNFAKNFDWKKLGKQLATGANSFVSNIDYEAIKGTVRDGINGITDALNEFLANFEASDFGDKIASTFKGIVNGVKWGEIGQALAGVWNKAWEFLATTIKGLGNSDGEGTGIGSAILNVLKGIVSNIDVHNMSDAISTFVNKIAEDIEIVFSDVETWKKLGENVGTGIAETIRKIDASQLADAISAMARALVTMISGAIEELWSNRDIIGGKIRVFLEKLDWGHILAVAAPLIGAKLALGIGGLTFASLKKALEIKMISLFTSVGNASGVTKAGSGLFGGLLKSLGDATTPGTVICAIVTATAELQKFNEVQMGGNGFLTEEGGAIDSFINKMQNAGAITKDTKDKLFELKEQWESKELSNSEFLTKFVETLADGGTNAEAAERYLVQLKNEISLTETQTTLLDSIVKQLGDTASSSAEKFDSLGSKDEIIKKVKTAIHETSQELGELGNEHLPAVQQDAQTRFEQMVREANSFKTAIERIIVEFDLTDEEVNTLRNTIDTQFGQEGVFDTLIGATDRAKTSMGELNSESKIAAMESKSAWEESKKSQITALQDADSQIEASKGLSTQAMIDEKLAMKEWEKQSEDSTGVVSKNISEAISNGKKEFENADYSESIKSGYTTSMEKSKESIKKDGYEAGKAGTEGMTEGAKDAVANSALSQSAKDLVTRWIDELEGSNGLDEHSPSKKTYQIGVYGVQGLTNGIVDTVSSLLDAVKNDLVGALDAQLEESLEDTSQKMEVGGGNVVESLISGMRETAGQFSITSFITNLFSGYSSKLNSIKNNFESYGEDIINALKEGIESVHIKAPRLEWDGGYTGRIYTDPTHWVQLPTYSVRWYAKGGLFTDPTIAGFGEAGAEAALPLENKRTMRMIADAIVDNASGGMGLSKQDVIDAVTYAMAVNAGNQPPVNVYATLYTEDNEVLARSVERGQRSRDMRYNPTAAY